jgi:hypothetical protein
MAVREELTPTELYKRAMRLRLTRAGLLKIVRENEQKELEGKEDNGTD